MIKIGFIGAASTGKTTLARATAAFAPLNLPEIKSAELVQEYARSYIKRYGFTDMAEQILLFDKQYQEEEAVHSSSDLLVTDSPLHLTYCYALNICQSEPTRRNQKLLSEVSQRVIKINQPPRYDILFHCKAGIIPQVDDGVRAPIHLDPEWSKEFDNLIVSTLGVAPARKIYKIETQDIMTRLEFVFDKIKSYINEYTLLSPDNSTKSNT